MSIQITKSLNQDQEGQVKEMMPEAYKISGR
jgi:hypothetical protein